MVQDGHGIEVERPLQAGDVQMSRFQSVDRDQLRKAPEVECKRLGSVLENFVSAVIYGR